MSGPRLPPVFRAVPLGGGDPFAWALAHAGEEGAGTLAWGEDDGRFRCAVVFEPDQPAPVARTVLFAAMLALGDTLGALGPPGVPLLFEWPNRIEVNGAVAAACDVAAGPEDAGVPSWLVLGATVALRPGSGTDEPGCDPGRTFLSEEGFGTVEAADLLELFARYLLNWVDRWQEDGFEAVRPFWAARHAAGGGGGLDGAGALTRADGTRVTLEAGLAAPAGRAG
jgi:BirA family biotin operon repressor/biotin-[acetyl-CoA-carboxylase] ligase